MPSMLPSTLRNSSSIDIIQRQTNFLKLTNNANKSFIKSETEGNVLTIVTAYFDIGTFQKETVLVSQRPESYFQWSTVFKYLRNPLVVYTDSEKFLHLMKSHRTRFADRTKYFWFDKNSSWAFSKRQAIQKMYSRPDYPSYIRANPTAANYSCVQHAKYEVTARAAKENYYNTNYIAWLDVGLFRHSISYTKDFVLELPSGFNDSKVALNLIHNVSMDKDFSDIFKNKIVWICECLFVGRRELVLRYMDQYKISVDHFLSWNLMNTDEQVVYATYTNKGIEELKPEIDLQLYWPKDSKIDHWFYIGYIMRRFI